MSKRSDRIEQVIIIGCSGSGKSNFGRKLKYITGLPLYHLDMVYWNEDIKKYADVIENRMDDKWCTLESVLEDNALALELARKHNVNYVLVDGKYEVNIDL